MKHTCKTLTLLTLTALLLAGCADTADVTDAGSRPRPTTATTTKAEPEPPAVARSVWAQHTDDPWADYSDTSTPNLGELYYELDPALAEGQTTDENTRYVMSFTYITADYYRYDLKDYLISRGFQAHEYAENENTSYYMLFDLTEAEIESITPEAVQAFYGLSEAPAVVGNHRANGYTLHSEVAWYRADLLWGEWPVYDVLTIKSGVINFADPLTNKENFKNPDRPLAVWCEVFADSDKTCKDYFASLGWEIMDDAYCLDSTNHSNMSADHVLIAATMDQLCSVDIAEMAEYYGCNADEMSVVFIHAMPQAKKD